eukprot:1852636-Amphidinium_carterae.1
MPGVNGAVASSVSFGSSHASADIPPRAMRYRVDEGAASQQAGHVEKVVLPESFRQPFEHLMDIMWSFLIRVQLISAIFC